MSLKTAESSDTSPEARPFIRSPNPEGSGFGVFCSLLDSPKVLEGPGRPMPNPEGSGFGLFCSLLDAPNATETPERPMPNPEGSGFRLFCSLPDVEEIVAGKREKNREEVSADEEGDGWVVGEYGKHRRRRKERRNSIACFYANTPPAKNKRSQPTP